MVRAVQASVDEVGSVAAAEAIDCGFAKGGALFLASTPEQLRRLEKRARAHEEHGLGDTYELLEEPTSPSRSYAPAG